MEHSDKWLEDGVIEGFFVPSMIRRAWACQLDILGVVDRICKDNNIDYYAHWGTLLGAVRHGGYIPWDDDMDIAMPRKDYKKFLEIAARGLPSGLMIHNYSSMEDHWHFVARIASGNHLCFEEEYLREHYGFPYVVGLDIFVLDNQCADRKKEELRAMKLQYSLVMADRICEQHIEDARKEEALRNIEEYTGCRISRQLSGVQLRRHLYEIIEDRLMDAFDDAESDKLVQLLPNGLVGQRGGVDKKLYEAAVYMPFENTSIRVPIGYQEVLKYSYGNYEVAVKSGGSHGYPFFEGQMENFIKQLDFELPQYRISAADYIAFTQSRIESIAAHKEDSVIDKRNDRMREVVFIPFAPDYWERMRPLYEREIRNNSHVSVVPIPKYSKAYDGSLYNEEYNLSKYPSDTEVIDYYDYNFKKKHPDVIYFQCPYDEWNDAISVPIRFYSDKLLSYTDELIYIPYFEEDDFDGSYYRQFHNMESYVTVPGVINADRVIVSKVKKKELYIEKLCEFMKPRNEKEESELRALLDEKITVDEALQSGLNIGDNVAAWDEGNVNSYKKHILYCIGIGGIFLYKERCVSKIRQVLSEFEKNSEKLEVSVCLINPADGYEDSENPMDMPINTVSGVLREYEARAQIRMVDEEEFRQRRDTMRTGMEFYDYDAYYGDVTWIMNDMARAGKPVMIQNYEIGD